MTKRFAASGGLRPGAFIRLWLFQTVVTWTLALERFYLSDGEACPPSYPAKLTRAKAEACVTTTGLTAIVMTKLNPSTIALAKVDEPLRITA